MRFTDLPLDRPVATIMVLVCLTVLGTVAIGYLPLAFMPIVAEPEIDIEVPFPGSHPLEALRDVVRPIEEEVATIPEVKQIFGSVRPGTASVEVQFEWSVNIDVKKMEVREAVERARAGLPDGIGHIRVEGDTDGPGAEVLGGRISAERDLSESWDLLDRRIRRPLERIKGVARVNLYGVEAQEVRIDIDLDSLKRHDLTVGEVVETIDKANLDLDLGSIRGDVVAYDVRSASRFRDVASVRDLALGVGGLRLRDVADVRMREPILDYGRHLNQKFAIGFDVFKEPTANTIEIVDKLNRRIEGIRDDPELQGINVLVWMDQGEQILGSLHGLRNAGIFGGMLAVVILFGFLRRFSTTVIVAIAIPFSLLVTCGGMLLFGMEFNVLTMLGLMLGIGMLVDNSVVVIENIYRLQGQGIPAPEAARSGARQVALAVLAATATTIIVWSWLFVSERSEMTIYIGQVALVICISVACSLLISLTFIPLAAARFVPHRAVSPGFLIGRVVPRYRALLEWSLSKSWHRMVVLAGLLALASSVAIPFSAINKTGEPAQEQSDVSIFYRIHDSQTKESLEKHIDTVEAWLVSRKEELGFKDVYSWYQEPKNAVTRVYPPRGENSEENMTRLREAMRVGLPIIPGIELEIGDHRSRHRGPREGVFVRVAVRGEDPEYLEELAAEVELMLKDLPHIQEVFGPSLIGNEEVRVQIDAERAHTLGLSPQRVADVVNFTFRGQRLRRYEGDNGEIEVILGLPETARPGLATLTDLPIPTLDGESIPLAAVAEIVVTRTPPHIQRVDRRTTSWVTMQFDEDEITTEQARELVGERLAGLRLPDGYSWDWGERHHDDDEALAVMAKGLLLSLVIVLMLMAALFESFSQPLAILITLPLALTGALWSLWLLGFDLEVLGFIGIIILVGVVVNNGIVMVDHVNSLRRVGRGRSAALVEGCGDRLRPVLMTAITTIFGLVPLAMSQFTVAGVYVQTLAVAMIGGLASSTVFTLIGLPVWYTTIEDIGAFLGRLLPSRTAKRLPLPRGGVLVSETGEGRGR